MSRSDLQGVADDPEFNPFAPPKAAAKAAVEEGRDRAIYRQGDLLVMDKRATLPDACVRCDAPTGHYRLRRNLSWHHPLFYLIVLVNLLIYVLVALIVRKTAKIGVPLCPEHRAKRRRTIAVAWAVALVGLATAIVPLFFLGPGPDPGPIVFLIPCGIIVLLIGLFYGAIAAPPVVPTRIDDRFVWLKRVGPAFLDRFPDWPGG